MQKLLVNCADNNGIPSAVVNLKKVLNALNWLKANNRAYADIAINENFRFTADDVIFDKPSTEEQLAGLIELGESHEHLLEPADTNIQLYIENESTNQADTAFQQYTLQKAPYNPTKWDLPDSDVKCFPKLFPNGNFGFDHVGRKPAIPHRQQIRARLLGADRRFGQSPEYLAMTHGLMAQKDIHSVMGVQARAKKAKMNAAGDFYNKSKLTLLPFRLN